MYGKRTNLDLAKAKAIQAMELPYFQTVETFHGRVYYVQIFIPILAELLESFHKLFKKNVPFA